MRKFLVILALVPATAAVMPVAAATAQPYRHVIQATEKQSVDTALIAPARAR